MFKMSEGLSVRHLQMAEEGVHLNDDSRSSEQTLQEAMTEIVQYATEKFTPLGYTIETASKITLFECQSYFHKVGGPTPNPDNKSVCMKPDGGILYAVKGDRIPILMVEDKVQGTNDIRFSKKLGRQATGNAIERGAKNIRGAEMLFTGDIFPYVLFASGCDFHPSETIAKRIEMMNMGYPNHSIVIDPSSTERMNACIALLPAIQVKKCGGKGIASVFVKSHKWNELPHGASLWKRDEQVLLLKGVIDKVLETFQ
jgi:hypothetical protein